MRVVQLFVKAEAKQPVSQRQMLSLKRGYGIEGDLNACVGSPRQVLIVDQRSLQQFGLQPGDLYENILIDGDIDQLVSGQILQIGDVLIRPTFACEPCSKLEKIRAGLAKQIKGQRGFLGMVVRGGTIHVGDAIISTVDRLPALSENVKERFYEFVARIPSGKIVRTCDVVLALGVANAYYRAIPTFLKKAPSRLPVHRIVATNGSLFCRYLPHQKDDLASEGVNITSSQNLEGCLWAPEHFHDLGVFDR